MLERVMSFLTTSPSLAEITSLTWFRGQPRQWRSGKDISLGTTCPIGHMFGTLSAPERKPPSCGPFGTKVVAINEWDARIATTSILGQCFICLVNTSESIKHKTRDCIQAKTLWWRATFVMHELQWGSGLATMTTLIGSKPSLVKKSPKICQVSFYLAPPRRITLWTIQTNWNHKVFNQVWWHETKVKYLIWGNLIMYMKNCMGHDHYISWNQALLGGGSSSRFWATLVFCRRDNVKIMWNWKRRHS